MVNYPTKSKYNDPYSDTYFIYEVNSLTVDLNFYA